MFYRTLKGRVCTSWLLKIKFISLSFVRIYKMIQDHEKMIAGESDEPATKNQDLSLIQEEGSFLDTSEGQLATFSKKISALFAQVEIEKEKIITSENMKPLLEDFEKLLHLECEYKPQQLNEFAMILSGLNCCLLDHRNFTRPDLEDFMNVLIWTLELSYHLQNHMGSENGDFSPPISKGDAVLSSEIKQFSQHFVEEDGKNPLDQPAEFQLLEVVNVGLKITQMQGDKIKIDDQRMIEAIAGVLRSMVNRLSNVLKEHGSINLSISNYITQQIIEIYKTVQKSKNLNEEYWKLAAQLSEDPFGLVFYSSLLAWNCRVDFQDPSAQSSKVSVIRYLGRVRHFEISKSNMIEGSSIEVKLVPDPKINNGQALLNVLDDYILVNHYLFLIGLLILI